MRRRKIERVKRVGVTGSKVEQHKGTIVTDATASSLAEKTRDSLVASINKTCSDRKSREDKYSDGIFESAGRVCTSVGFIYHGGRYVRHIKLGC